MRALRRQGTSVLVRYIARFTDHLPNTFPFNTYSMVFTCVWLGEKSESYGRIIDITNKTPNLVFKESWALHKLHLVGAQS